VAGETVRRLIRRLRSPEIASWLSGAGWVLTSSLVERAAALLQTILIARAIGIEDYGRYALFFVTIGALAPLVNLQLGYAIIVHLSRRRSGGGESAGALLAFTEIVTNLSVALLLLGALLFAEPLSRYLFGSPDQVLLIVCAGVMLLLTTKTGIYDCILQAYEDFRILALARVATALGTLVLLGLTIRNGGGLFEIILALVVCALGRLLIVRRPSREISQPLVAGITHERAMAEMPVLLSFCLPSALVSLASGYTSWVGLHALSLTSGGLGDVAVVNTAMQWRMPVLIVTASLATSLLPRLSRALGSGDLRQARRLSLVNLGLNVGLAVLTCIGVGLCARPILGLYGPSFVSQSFLFLLFLLPVILTVFVNTLQQTIVAAGRMWVQWWIMVPNLVVNVAGVWHFGSALNGERLGYIQLVGTAVTALVIGIVSHISRRAHAAPHS